MLEDQSDLMCSICFCPFNDGEYTYSCANPACAARCCIECIASLISFSEKSSLLPTCPSTNCNAIFILSGLQNLNLGIIKLYESACFSFFCKEQSDNIKKRIAEQQIVNKIRDERLKFIEKSFPKSITLVANLTFKDKLKQLDKQKTAIVNLKIRNSSKACLIGVCGGFLDPDFVCMNCSTPFCKYCEKKLTANHKCNQEDLDSVNLVNNMIKCPGCKLPVFKNEGCDSITCSNCQTNFSYSTGKEGGHGSSNAKINVEISKKIKLSTEYENIIPKNCLLLILKIEALEPPFKSKDILLIPIKTYIQKGENTKATCAKELAKKLDIYTKSKYRKLLYQKCLVEVSNLLENKELNDDKLKGILTETLTMIKLLVK